MTKFIFINVLITALSFSGMAQPSSIENALKTLKSESITPYLDKRVELTIADYSGMVSSTEAARRLSEFYSQKKPSRYKTNHDAQSKGEETQYFIGSLSTSTGSYRMYFFLKSKGSQWLIQELRIEKD